MAANVMFESLFKAAKAAGVNAGLAAVPAPMVVSEHANPLNDNSAINRMWVVADGPCGFAWINVRPGNSAFAKWVVKVGFGRKAYEGGVNIYIHDHNQSIVRKEAHAYAMADVLKDAGIKAYANSRMD